MIGGVEELLNRKELRSDELILQLKEKFGQNWHLHLKKEKDENDIFREKKEKNLKKPTGRPKGIPRKVATKSILNEVVYCGKEQSNAVIKRTKPPSLDDISLDKAIEKKNLSCRFYFSCLLKAEEAEFNFFSCEKCPNFPS